LLSVWELSAPGLGTIRAKSIPLTFLTSNAERDIADPLRRRSFYIEVRHPTPELEARIVAYKTPSLPIETHVFIAGMAQALRVYTMKKPPSISEMCDIAVAMELMHLKTIMPTPEQREIFLPLLAKRKDDIGKLRLGGAFADIVNQANYFVLHVKLKIAEERGEVSEEVLDTPVDKIVDRLRTSEEDLKRVEAISFTSFPDREIKLIEAEKASFEASKKG
jgi:hypothetical protein